MERLTHARNNGIKQGYWSPNKKDELIDRLAAYENTGLSPEDVEKVNSFEKSQTGILLKKLCEERNKHKWITLVLPKEGESVLATVDGKCENIEFEDAVLFASFICGEGWILEDYPECTEFTVKAWMYLPEPYHGEEVDNE